MKPFSFLSEVWIYPGLGGWHFVSLDDALSRRIRVLKEKKTKGFGFVPIEARIGKTAWKTTLFPTKEGRYLLSIKAVVRKKEGIHERDKVKISFVCL